MNCKICNKILVKRQKMYCSPSCKHLGYTKHHNTHHSNKKRGHDRKILFVKHNGGKCTLCGYDKNLSALTFHHMNPKEKRFLLDTKKLGTINLKDCELELAKCILVCANCHMEIEHPNMNLKDLMQVMNEMFNM